MMTYEQYVWRSFVVFHLVVLVVYIKLDALFAWGVLVCVDFVTGSLAVYLKERWERH